MEIDDRIDVCILTIRCVYLAVKTFSPSRPSHKQMKTGINPIKASFQRIEFFLLAIEFSFFLPNTFNFVDIFTWLKTNMQQLELPCSCDRHQQFKDFTKTLQKQDLVSSDCNFCRESVSKWVSKVGYFKFKVILRHQLEILLNSTFLRGNALTVLKMVETNSSFKWNNFHLTEFFVSDISQSGWRH